MRKDIFKIALLLLFGWISVGCDLTEDNIFSESADERLVAALEIYEEALISAPNGWLLLLETSVSGGFVNWVSFNAEGRVTMLSDIELVIADAAGSATTPKESSYRLKAIQTPSIIFDTYTYIHQLADPQNSVNGGTNGYGLITDFEFQVVSYDNGIFTLCGAYNDSAAYLIPATAAQASAIINDGALLTCHDEISDFADNYKAAVVEINGVKNLFNISSRYCSTYAVSGSSLSNNSYTCAPLLTNIGTDASASDIIFLNAEINGEAISKLEYRNDEGYYLVTEENEYPVYDNEVAPFDCEIGYNKLFTGLYFTTSTDYDGTMSQSYFDTYYYPGYSGQAANSRTLTSFTLTFTTGSDGLPTAKLDVVSLTNSTGTSYTATWYLSFTENADGTITFYDRSEYNSNAQNYGRYMRSALDIFTTITYSTYSYSNSTYTIVKDQITPHTFKAGWVENNSSALKGQLIGALIDVDDPDMYFCGVVQQFKGSSNSSYILKEIRL